MSYDKSQLAYDAFVVPWVNDVIDTLRNYTGRRIVIHPSQFTSAIEHEWTNVVRSHPMHIQGSYDDFDFDPTKAWAVIVGLQSVTCGCN